MIAGAIEEQITATGEISRNVEEAKESALLACSNIAELQRGVTHANDSSVEVQEAAQSLWLDSNRLQEAVGEFLGKLRAAWADCRDLPIVRAGCPSMRHLGDEDLVEAGHDLDRDQDHHDQFEP